MTVSKQKLVNGFVDLVNERYRYFFAVKLLHEAKKHQTEQKKQETVKKIRQLWKAINYLDEIAIPDSLRTLRKTTTTPLFSISEWLAKTVSKK